MTVKFSHNLFMLPFMQVKAQYRNYENTLFKIDVPNKNALFIMLYQYTQEEYN